MQEFLESLTWLSHGFKLTTLKQLVYHPTCEHLLPIPTFWYVYLWSYFTATTVGSLSVDAEEEMSIVEHDNGDGWTRIRRNNGEEGFVPTSYIRILWETQAIIPYYSISGSSLECSFAVWNNQCKFSQIVMKTEWNRLWFLRVEQEMRIHSVQASASPALFTKLLSNGGNAALFVIGVRS